MSQLVWVYDPEYQEHGKGIQHPERPERLAAVVNRFEESGLSQEMQLLSPQTPSIEWIEDAHTKDHINLVKKNNKKELTFLDSDTYVQQKSYDIALLACGGTITAADGLFQNGSDTKHCFCAVRPPGHHAENNRPMGFCLFNNIAVLTKYIQKQYAVEKVLIIDWDVHHGNGTQDIFYSDPSVLFISLHQYPLYPGTGAGTEIGRGEGERFTLNIPLTAGRTDDDYLHCFDKQVEPEVMRFNPEIILISAGFDAHRDDPLAGMNLTSKGFGRLTKQIVYWADEYSEGRIISVLEGGYNLKALSDSVESHIINLL